MKYWMARTWNDVHQCCSFLLCSFLYIKCPWIGHGCVCCDHMPSAIFVCVWECIASGRRRPTDQIHLSRLAWLLFLFFLFCFHLSVIFIDCDLCGCAERLSSCNTVIKAVLHFNTTMCFHRSLGLRLAPACHVKCASPRRAFWTWVASWRFQSHQEEGIQTVCRLRFLTHSYNHSQTPAELFSLAPFVSCTPLCH